MGVADGQGIFEDTRGVKGVYKEDGQEAEVTGDQTDQPSHWWSLHGGQSRDQ